MTGQPCTGSLRLARWGGRAETLWLALMQMPPCQVWQCRGPGVSPLHTTPGDDSRLEVGAAQERADEQPDLLREVHEERRGLPLPG